MSGQKNLDGEQIDQRKKERVKEVWPDSRLPKKKNTVCKNKKSIQYSGKSPHHLFLLGTKDKQDEDS